MQPECSIVDRKGKDNVKIRITGTLAHPKEARGDVNLRQDPEHLPSHNRAIICKAWNPVRGKHANVRRKKEQT